MNNSNKQSFKDVINKYMNILKCSQKELSEASKVDSSIISRFIRGEKTPTENSIQIQKIIDGIYKLSINKKIKLEKEIIAKEINSSINKTKKIDYKTFRKNLNILIEKLNIKVTSISKNTGYDPSYISKIRTGVRNPGNIDEFAELICTYIVKNNLNEENKLKLDAILKNNKSNIDYIEELKKWLIVGNKISNTNIEIYNLLKSIDIINPKEYIKVIKEKNNKPLLSLLPKNKKYHGNKEIKNAEIDYFNGIYSSKIKELFMYNDMPTVENLNHEKWFNSLAINFTKNIHLNIIHNLDCSLIDTILKLEEWMPLYLTGKISPYYLKEYTNDYFGHLYYTSKSHVLVSSCIKGYQNKCDYYLTNNKSDIKHYNEISAQLLSKASPLIEIYNEEKIQEYNKFYKTKTTTKKNRIRFLTNLPIETISDKLFEKLLIKNKISKKDSTILKKSLKEKKESFNKVLKESIIEDHFYIVSKKEFNKIIPKIIINKSNQLYELKYDYEDYEKHYKETLVYKNSNYKIKEIKKKIFDNININIIENDCVIVSKESEQIINLVFKYQSLVDAINNYLLIEEK